jgi:3-oxoacyl-[acyl-carrier-protein] synthase-3
MAELIFHQAGLMGIVTTVGGRRVMFDDEREALGLTQADAERLKRSVGLNSRHVVTRPTTTTSDLCLHSAQRLLEGLDLTPDAIDGLILVTQTPDFASPSTAMRVQDQLGMRVDTVCFDMRLGCSGFVYGLAMACSLVESGLNRVLLCVGDVASRMVPIDNHAITPLMGDAGAAVLIERRPAASRFQLYSDGSGEKGLYIPNSGLRQDTEDEGRPPYMVMNGAAVFNFTLKRVPAMITNILDFAGWAVAGVDQFVLHQPNKYILGNIQKRLGLDDDKLPSSTQSIFGNQNSASIPGTISGLLAEKYSSQPMKSIFAGFGVGLSWAACAVETQPLFAPAPFLFESESP